MHSLPALRACHTDAEALRVESVRIDNNLVRASARRCLGAQVEVGATRG